MCSHLQLPSTRNFFQCYRSNICWSNLIICNCNIYRIHQAATIYVSISNSEIMSLLRSCIWTCWNKNYVISITQVINIGNQRICIWCTSTCTCCKHSIICYICIAHSCRSYYCWSSIGCTWNLFCCPTHESLAVDISRSCREDDCSTFWYFCLITSLLYAINKERYCMRGSNIFFNICSAARKNFLGVAVLLINTCDVIGLASLECLKSIERIVNLQSCCTVWQIILIAFYAAS